jgi:mono/diheme cytochrome c family protein
MCTLGSRFSRAGAAVYLSVLVAGSLSASPALAAGEQAASLSESRQLFIQACAPCHGLAGTGNGPVAAALVTPPSDLTQLSARHGGIFPRDDVAAVLSGDRPVRPHGSREMPVWNQRFGVSGGTPTGIAAIYARRRLDLLLSQLESIQREAPVTTPAPTP